MILLLFPSFSVVLSLAFFYSSGLVQYKKYFGTCSPAPMWNRDMSRRCSIPNNSENVQCLFGPGTSQDHAQHLTTKPLLLLPHPEADQEHSSGWQTLVLCHSRGPHSRLTSTRSPSRKSFSPFFTEPLSDRLDPDSLPVFMALFRTLSLSGITRLDRGGVAVPECSDKFWAVRESTEGASLPEPSATGCRVSLDGRVKIPCSGWHSKYRTPPTEPSFLPTGSSRTTPAHWPGANWVSPRYWITPGFTPFTQTRSPTTKSPRKSSPTSATLEPDLSALLVDVVPCLCKGEPVDQGERGFGIRRNPRRKPEHQEKAFTERKHLGELRLQVYTLWRSNLSDAITHTPSSAAKQSAQNLHLLPSFCRSHTEHKEMTPCLHPLYNSSAPWQPQRGCTGVDKLKSTGVMVSA